MSWQRRNQHDGRVMGALLVLVTLAGLIGFGVACAILSFFFG